MIFEWISNIAFFQVTLFVSRKTLEHSLVRIDGCLDVFFELIGNRVLRASLLGDLFSPADFLWFFLNFNIFFDFFDDFLESLSFLDDHLSHRYAWLKGLGNLTPKRMLLSEIVHFIWLQKGTSKITEENHLVLFVLHFWSNESRPPRVPAYFPPHYFV